MVGFTAAKMLKDPRIAFPLGIAMVFLLFLPGNSSADIESLYAGGCSSSVAITNPSNAYGAPDGNMAELTDKEKWGVFLQNWTFSMADSANTTEVFQSAEFYFTHYVGNGYFDDYIDLEYSPDNGENWYLLKRYTELDPPPTSLTTGGPFRAPVISSWTQVDSTRFRLIGKAVGIFMLFGDPAMEVKVQTSSSPGSVDSGGQCFIATAAYGSYAEGHVLILTKFRDQYLLLNALGRSLIRLYYRYSPRLATSINERDSLKSVARMGLSPLVGLSMLFNWADLPQRWPLLVTMAVIISVLLYMELLVRRQRVLTKD